MTTNKEIVTYSLNGYMWISIFAGSSHHHHKQHYHNHGHKDLIYPLVVAYYLFFFSFAVFLALFKTCSPACLLAYIIPTECNWNGLRMVNSGIYEISEFFVATLGCGLCARVCVCEHIRAVLASK